MPSTFSQQPNVSIRHVFVTSREINREWDEDDENFVIGKFPELTREELNERLGAKPAEEYGAKAYHEEAVCTDWPVHRVLDRLSELGYNVHEKIVDSRGYHTWMLTKKMATVKSSPVLVHAVVSHYSSTLMNKSCEGTFIGTTFPAMDKEELMCSLGALPAGEQFDADILISEWPVHRVLDRLSELGYTVHTITYEGGFVCLLVRAVQDEKEGTK